MVRVRVCPLIVMTHETRFLPESTSLSYYLLLSLSTIEGNGIQDLTYDDPQIFYLSIHRSIYPWTGKPKEVGNGMNLNISFSKPGMGDAEYAACFSDVVLPLMNQFKPDIVFIACGLDPVKGDLLGDCGLSPEMFYTMTRSVLEADSVVACDIPVVVALEGGYNVEQSADCMGT